MSRTVVVTGGCGFIGSHLVRLLRREHPDWRVVNLDKLTYAGNRESCADLAEGDGYRFVHGDVADRERMRRLIREEHPDAILHLAAESHVDRSILDPTAFLQTNVLGTQVLLEAAREIGVARVLYVSTDEVYGDVDNQPCCTEESPLRPSSPYAASKAAADLLTQAYRRTYGLPIVIARPCNHYGPSQFPEKLIPFMIRRILRGETLPVYGDGRHRRDWLYVEDGARALLAILTKGHEGAIYNIAAHQERQNLDVVRLLCELMAARQGTSAQALWERIELVADRPGHDVRYAVDDSRLRQETAWQPLTELGDGVERTVAWYLAHRDWLDRTETEDFVKHFARPSRP